MYSSDNQSQVNIHLDYKVVTCLPLYRNKVGRCGVAEVYTIKWQRMKTMYIKLASIVRLKIRARTTQQQQQLTRKYNHNINSSRPQILINLYTGEGSSFCTNGSFIRRPTHNILQTKLKPNKTKTVHLRL